MAEQYFTENPTVDHDEHHVNYHLNGINLNLTTDAGVFSKNRVDYGSGVLIEQMLDQELPGGNILDVGCGYGPIGLFAAKKWPGRQVDMVDVNERPWTWPEETRQANGQATLIFCLRPLSRSFRPICHDRDQPADPAGQSHLVQHFVRS